MVVENLKASRENMFLKQKDISKIFNNNPSTISGWETGKDTIPLEKLVLYANYFNLSLDYLFGTEKRNSFKKVIVVDREIIGRNLKRMRKLNNYTQEYVAFSINISQGTYCDYENGNRLISTISLYSLSKLYVNFSFDKLFEIN